MVYQTQSLCLEICGRYIHNKNHAWLHVLIENSMFSYLQGTVEIVFNVYDLDFTTSIEDSSDLVDNIFIYPSVSATIPSSFSDPMTYSGIFNFSYIELAFNLTCGADHYGPDCTLCIETNDTTGHYTCDTSTGEKVCLEGYQEPQTNCVNTDCSPIKSSSKYIVIKGDCE